MLYKRKLWVRRMGSVLLDFILTKPSQNWGTRVELVAKTRKDSNLLFINLRWGFTWKKRTFCIACSNHSFNPNHNKLYITGKLILQRFWKRMFLCTASKSNLVPGCQRHYPQCKSLGYLRKDFSLQTSQTNKLLMLFQRIVPNCWYEWRILQNCKITCQKSHLKLNHQNVGDFSLIIFSPASPWQIPSFISIHLMSTNSPENFRSIA